MTALRWERHFGHGQRSWHPAGRQQERASATGDKHDADLIRATASTPRRAAREHGLRSPRSRYRSRGRSGCRARTSVASRPPLRLSCRSRGRRRRADPGWRSHPNDVRVVERKHRVRLLTPIAAQMRRTSSTFSSDIRCAVSRRGVDPTHVARRVSVSRDARVSHDSTPSSDPRSNRAA